MKGIGERKVGKLVLCTECSGHRTINLQVRAIAMGPGRKGQTRGANGNLTNFLGVLAL